jgi:hypothetical protein
MITCDRCGRVNGKGAKGDSWICGDCKMEPAPEKNEEQNEDDDASSEGDT